MLVTIPISLFIIVCTGYLGDDLSWALQTSMGMSGWAAPRQYVWNVKRGTLALPRVTPMEGAAA